MTKFKVGDKVRRRMNYGNDNFPAGSIYTVTGFVPSLVNKWDNITFLETIHFGNPRNFELIEPAPNKGIPDWF